MATGQNIRTWFDGRWHDSDVAVMRCEVAESATADVLIVRDGEVFTPIGNGTFLVGINRARHIANLKADGVAVHECVLTFDDVRRADEVFLSGNMSKVTPVTEFDGTKYPHGPVTKRIRGLYMDWAHSGA